MEEDIGINKATWKVATFHRSINAPIAEAPNALTQDRLAKRVAWILEEVEELSASKNEVEQVDALIDIVYFVLGAFVEMGIEPAQAFKIVHTANMEKAGNAPVQNLPGEKARKSANWISPEEKLRRELYRQRSLKAKD